MKVATNGYIPTLKKFYLEKGRVTLQQEFGHTSIMQVPCLEKIVLSMGVGEAIQNRKLLDSALEEMSLIAGQRATRTKARKSISNFKVRAGMETGVKVTLRGDRMYDFFSRLINVALPRVRDFRGMSVNAFDGHGNYSIGIEEQIIFPEIDYDKIERIGGFNIVIVTSASTDGEARSLLAVLGMPFRK